MEVNSNARSNGKKIALFFGGNLKMECNPDGSGLIFEGDERVMLATIEKTLAVGHPQDRKALEVVQTTLRALVASGTNEYDAKKELPFNAHFELMAMCDVLKETLARKNTDYGNAALDPKVKIFSKHLQRTTDGITIRLDDKLERIANLGLNGISNTETVDDTILDVAGYLMLLLVARKRERNLVHV